MICLQSIGSLAYIYFPERHRLRGLVLSRDFRNAFVGEERSGMIPEVSGFLRLSAQGFNDESTSEREVVSGVFHVDNKLWTKGYLTSGKMSSHGCIITRQLATYMVAGSELSRSGRRDPDRFL